MLTTLTPATIPSPTKPFTAPSPTRFRYQLHDDDGGCWRGFANTMVEAVVIARQRVAELAKINAASRYPFTGAVNILDAEACEREATLWQVNAERELTPMQCKCAPDVAFTFDGVAVRAGDRVKLKQRNGSRIDTYLTVGYDPRMTDDLICSLPTAECLSRLG